MKYEEIKKLNPKVRAKLKSEAKAFMKEWNDEGVNKKINLKRAMELHSTPDVIDQMEDEVEEEEDLK